MDESAEESLQFRLCTFRVTPFAPKTSVLTCFPRVLLCDVPSGVNVLLGSRDEGRRFRALRKRRRRTEYCRQAA